MAVAIGTMPALDHLLSFRLGNESGVKYCGCVCMCAHVFACIMQLQADRESTGSTTVDPTQLYVVYVTTQGVEEVVSSHL